MKKHILIAVLALAAGLGRAETGGVIGPFSGLNDTDNPLIIGQGQAQDLLNVEMTPGGKSVKKRRGFGLAFNTAVTTSAVHGVYAFYDATGNQVALAFNDRYLTASVNGAAPTTLFSTGTLDATWQCTDTLGWAYCASSARNPVIKTNGVTYSQLPMTSTGTMVAATTQRLATSGFSGTPSQINFSKANDFATWTTGPLATDAYTDTINAPGSRITHIAFACGNLVWFKDASFGMVINPDDQFNAQVVTVSPTLGTLDNSSVYYNGVLHFRAQDGHFYDFDCSSLQKMSRDLQGTISVSGQRRANSWMQSTSSDFSAGVTSNTTVSTSGVAISTTNTNISNNSFESEGVWTNGSQWTRGSGGYPRTLTNCTITAAKDGNAEEQYTGTGGAGYTITANLRDAGTSSVLATTSFAYANNSCTWTARGLSAVPTSVKTLVNIQLVSSENATRTLTSPNFAYSGSSITFYTASDLVFGMQVLYVDYFTNGVTTNTAGSYFSAVHNGPSLTSWDTLNVTQTANGGTQTFYMRSSTNSFTTLSSTPSWTAQTAGAVINITTGTYFQFRDDFSVTVASQNPTLTDFTINWFEGGASDKVYGTYFDNAIWWAVQKGAGATSNNYVLRYELENKAWTLFDIAANGFYLRDNALYFGSATAGKVYKFGDVDSDAGSAINSYWKSKDFFGADPFTENEFRKMSISAKMVTNSSMTVTYTLNGSSSAAYTVPLYSATSNFIKNNRNLPASTNGSYLNVKVGNNAADQPWEVFGIGYTYEPKPWRVSQ